MIKNTLLALTLAGALATSASFAFAGDTEADQRYHEAYVLEVVDGKIGDAAREYLALTNDDDAPARIRAESRFRFAICTVLLGRADEARIQLADLIRDADVPAAVKQRARDYLEAVQQLGVGKEIDKRMQDLVFELGRIQPNDLSVPNGYRDFEVIGDPARPFLRGLLDHSDATVRFHAFRILCRMKEPGMVARWEPAYGDHKWLCRDLLTYLDGDADELARFEARLKELEDDQLDASVRFFLPRLSVDFLRTLPARGVTPLHMINAARAHPDEVFWYLIDEWTRGDDPELALSAVQATGGRLGESLPAGMPRPGQLLAYTKVALDQPWSATTSRWHGMLGAQAKLARGAPAGDVLGCLDAVITASESWAGREIPSPLDRGLGWVLAPTLDRRQTPEMDWTRYRDLLKRWIHHYTQPRLGSDGKAVRTTTTIGNDISHHLRATLHGLGDEDAAPFTTWLLSPDCGLDFDEVMESLSLDSPRIADGLLGAASGLSAASRERLLERACKWERTPDNELSTGVERIVAQLFPTLAQERPKAVNNVTAAAFQTLVVMRGGESGQALLAQVLDSVAALPHREGASVLGSVLPRANQRPDEAARFYVDAMIPLVRTDWRSLEPYECDELVTRNLFNLLELDRRGQAELTDAHERAILDFLRERMDAEGVQKNERALAIHLGSFDLARLVRIAPDAFDHGALQQAAREHGADQVAVAWVAGREAMDVKQWEFVRNCCAKETARTLVDRALGGLPVAELGPLTRALWDRGSPASPDALKAALRRVMDAPEAPGDVLGYLARYVGSIDPAAPDLIPAVRRLLQGSTSGGTYIAFELAQQLGSVDVVPDLAAVMESLNPEVRKRAKAAIDSILELERLRREARELGGSDQPK